MEGVKGLYYRLDKMANRMVECPSDYSFQLRLFEGMPSWIHDTLLERNIFPEFCTLEDICKNMRQIDELSTRVHSNFKGTLVASLLRRISSNPPRSSNNYSSNNRVLNAGSRSNCNVVIPRTLQTYITDAATNFPFRKVGVPNILTRGSYQNGNLSYSSSACSSDCDNTACTRWASARDPHSVCPMFV